MIDGVNNFLKFLGSKVVLLLILDLFLGLLWFVVESGFLIVFQGFLISINVMTLDNARLPSWYPTTLEENLFILLVFGLFRAVLIGCKKHIPTVASNSFMMDQRLRVISRAFYLGGKSSTAEIISMFGDLTNKSGQFILHICNSLTMFISVTCLFVLCLKIAWIETIISMSLLIIFMLPLKFFTKKIRSNGAGLVSEWEKANMILLNGINNIFLLTIYNVLGKEFENAKSRLQRYEDHYHRYSLISSIVMGFPVFLGILIIVIVTYVSKKFLSTDNLAFIGFLYVFLRLAQSASNLSVSFSHALFYQKSFLNLFRFTKDVRLNVTDKNIFNENLNQNFKPVSIQFQNVVYSYSNGTIVINDLSFLLPEGKVLLIKGQSGSGKSTLVKILLDFVQPQEGFVKLDGEYPKDFVEKRFQSIGYVGPEPFLIPGTVKENLLYGNHKFKEISDKEIFDVLIDVGLNSLVINLKLGLDEFLYEDAQFSTGQKQRIAFARALLRKPTLLVLDEATANIDSETESAIIKNIESQKGLVTMVIISHRESFDRIADLEIVLN